MLHCNRFHENKERGAVAQLGERVVRNDEVGSSILLGSTTLFNGRKFNGGKANGQKYPLLVLPLIGVVICVSALYRRIEATI